MNAVGMQNFIVALPFANRSNAALLDPDRFAPQASGPPNRRTVGEHEGQSDVG
jgi:hypothetical protein